MPDNYQLRIKSNHFKDIEHFASLLFGQEMAKFRSFKSYTLILGEINKDTREKVDVLYIYSTDEGKSRFPFEKEVTDPKRLANFILDFLDVVSYPPQPDHDGSNKKGYDITSEKWNYISVKPCWMMYGK